MDEKKRRFVVTFEVIDAEGPDEDDLTSADAMKDFVSEALSDLAMEIKTITCISTTINEFTPKTS